MPDTGGELLVAIVQPQYLVIFYRQNGTQATGRHGRLPIPASIVEDFGRLLPLVVRPRLRAPARRLPGRPGPQSNGRPDFSPASAACGAKAEGRHHPGHRQTESAGGVR